MADGCRLFVGNLSWGTTDQSLGEAFGCAGAVTDAKVITDKYTGRSRGFGFVTFATPDEAQRAIQELNGRDVDGREIRVDVASARQG